MPLRNPRYERFAYGLADGKPAYQAYIDAGFAKGALLRARPDCSKVSVPVSVSASPKSYRSATLSAPAPPKAAAGHRSAGSTWPTPRNSPTHKGRKHGGGGRRARPLLNSRAATT
jgi:hypothetical protein